MKRAKRAVPLLAVLSSPCRRAAAFGHVAKAQALRAYSLLKSAAKALRAMTRRRPRGMRSCQSGLIWVHVQERHLQNWPIPRYGAKVG